MFLSRHSDVSATGETRLVSGFIDLIIHPKNTLTHEKTSINTISNPEHEHD